MERLQRNITVEVCCGSADDVVQAAEAGADRAELNLSLEAGGLTPSIGMLKTALAHAKIPIICMVRPRAGGFCYSDFEYQTMLDDAKRLMDAGAAGIAFGCLRADGTLDTDRCGGMVEAIGGGEAVFHRAFDVMHGGIERDIDDLVSLGLNRVLTSGRMPTSPEGAEAIRRCVRHAGDRLEVLAGGGVRPHNVKQLIADTGIRQVHFTFHHSYEDRSAAGARMNFDAPGVQPFAVRIVDGAELGRFLRQFRAESGSLFT